MSTSELPEDAIEAAAKAIEAQEKFGTVPRSVMIRAALSAASPFIAAQALREAAEEWAERSQTFLKTMEHMMESREYSHDDILRYGAYSAEAQVAGYRLRARAAAIRDGRHD